ncbi:hypothetical protein BKG91_11665 [Rodentibacter caecimuris]|uniref:hypothetical protein n=1 Tax=Rodentibacter caecimuris TaxID=1796644 RepID=UPI0007514878|nr:hypothetical protein [Rodentibacter heylii]AOF53681.1 hypothetical protein AC062_1589 [Pasteurellaceae bacterium NI1060]OOF71215.1 hypothetical protein BKG91_11665 [Rodentibacter heylii]
MKKLFLISAVSLLLAGCIQSPYNSQVFQDIQKASTNVQTNEFGNDFNENLVPKIIKGKTTEQQLIAMFGEPNMKLVLNEKDTKWNYFHTKMQFESPTYMTGSLSDFQNNIKQSSMTKTLDILVRNGKVLNYALQKADPTIKTNTKTKIDPQKLN